MRYPKHLYCSKALVLILASSLAVLTWAANVTNLKSGSGGQTLSQDVPHQPPKDSDGDGLADTWEAQIGTDPSKSDTDGDGTSDGQERRNGTDPLNPASGAALAEPPSMPSSLWIVSAEGSNLSLRWTASEAAPNRSISHYEIHRNGAKTAETEHDEAERTVSYAPSGPVWEYFKVRAVDNSGKASDFSPEVRAPRNTGPVFGSVNLEAKYAYASATKTGFREMVSKIKTYRTAHYAHNWKKLGTYETKPVDTEEQLTHDVTYDLTTGRWQRSASGQRVSRDGGQSGTWAMGTGSSAELRTTGGTRIDTHAITSTNLSATFGTAPTTADETTASLQVDSTATSSTYGDSYRYTRQASLTLSNEFTDADLETQVGGLYAQATGLLSGLGWFQQASASVDGLVVANLSDSFPSYLAERHRESLNGAFNDLRFVGSIYRLRAGGSQAQQVRWGEVFYPEDGSSAPVTLRVREVTLPAEADGAATEEYSLEPPQSPGGIALEQLGSGVIIGPPPDPENPSKPRLYLLDSLFIGDALEITLATQVPPDAFGSVRAVVTYPEDKLRLVAVDPAVVSAEGMAAAIARGYAVPSGTDLYNDPNWPGVGGWKLMAVGLASGTAQFSARLTTPFEATDLNKTLTVYAIPHVAVDANRDGQIKLASEDASDATSADLPYRFWPNDDDDQWVNSSIPGVYDEWEQDDRDITNPNMEDWRDHRIDDTRDLEDFARLWIHFGSLQDVIASGNIKIGLKWANISRGAPSIKLHNSIEEDGGTGYLFNAAVAQQQFERDYAAISDARYSDPDRNLVEGTSAFVLPRYIFQHPATQAYRDTAHLLFEGCVSGAGQLKLVILDKNDQEIGEGPGVWMDIQEPKNFIERWSAGDGDLTAIQPVVRESSNSASPSWGNLTTDEEKDYVLYVHGYNMKEFEKQRWIETMFKRLYWLGYKGRVGGFTWPCSQSALPYDASEERAWESAVQLKTLLSGLKTAGYRVHVMAHSQGNVVAGEALRQWAAENHKKADGSPDPLVRTYIASQAAIQAHCYDMTAPLIPGFAGSLSDDGTPNVYVNYPPTGAPYLGAAAMSGAATNWLNFENPGDYALTGNSLDPLDFHPGWQVNQRLKPDAGTGMGYNAVDGFFTSTSTGIRSLVIPAERFKIFSYLAEGRSLALGSTTTGGVFAGNNTDLAVTLSYGLHHRFHSGQFRSFMSERYEYWRRLMLGIGLQPFTP